MFDAYEELSFAEGIPLQTLTDGTVLSAAIKIGGAVTGKPQELLVCVDVGTFTDGIHTFTLEACATSGGSYVVVAGSNLRGAALVVDDGSNDEGIVGYIGYRPDENRQDEFIKIKVVSSGCTTGLADVQAHAILADMLDVPVRT